MHDAKGSDNRPFPTIDSHNQLVCASQKPCFAAALPPSVGKMLVCYLSIQGAFS